MPRQSREKLSVNQSIMYDAKCLACLTFFIHRDEHGKLLVCIASDKLFHIATAPLLGF
jgi:hypothetical protein